MLYVYMYTCYMYKNIKLIIILGDIFHPGLVACLVEEESDSKFVFGKYNQR